MRLSGDVGEGMWDEGGEVGSLMEPTNLPRGQCRGKVGVNQEVDVACWLFVLLNVKQVNNESVVEGDVEGRFLRFVTQKMIYLEQLLSPLPWAVEKSWVSRSCSENRT